MNNRVNLLYFIEHLLDASQAKNSSNYIQMIQSDLPIIVDSVAPDDPSGLQNIGSVRKVLTKIRDKSFIMSSTYNELMRALQERETGLGGVSTAPASTNHIINDENINGRVNGTHNVEVKYDETVISGRSRSPMGSAESSNSNPKKHNTLLPSSKLTTSTNTSVSIISEDTRRIGVKAIEQRMEEDRERHKRLRENIWAVFPPTVVDGVDINSGQPIGSNFGIEFEDAWNDEIEGEINEDDMEEILEEADIKRQSVV